MLVLSRKKEEGIVIDGNIEIKVTDIGDGRVKLGITAPKDKEIVRSELYHKVQDANKSAISKKSQLQHIKASKIELQKIEKNEK